jgi:putative redox protein
LNTNQQVVASLDGADGFTTQMKVGKHFMTADEPEKFGGNDFGPSPYELLTAGLSACTVMTLQMYAKRKGWPLDNVEVHTSYTRNHAVDCEDCEKDSSKIDTFNKTLILRGELSEEQRARLLEIADRCPVHKTLLSPTQVITILQ